MRALTTNQQQTHMKHENKTCKHACKKACVCKNDHDGAKVPFDVDAVVRKMFDDNRRKAGEYADAAKKLEGVMRFLSREAQSCADVCKALSGMVVEGGKETAGCAGYDPADRMFRIMVERSKFDFSGFDVSGRRVPELDDGNSVSFAVSVGKTEKDDAGTTRVCSESAIVRVTPILEDSIAAFDTAVSSFTVMRPPLKAKPKPTKDESVDLAKDGGKEFKKPVKKPTAKPKVKKQRVTPMIDDLKKTVLECSKYAVPSSRVKFVASHVDVKHGNFVYEVQFFQKSYKSVPADKQSYEPAYLNVRIGGDRDDLIAKRFDKIVEGLKFNSFESK